MTPTHKKRISITAEPDVQQALARAAKRDGVLVTTKATELLKLALELEEDLALANVVEKRLALRHVKYYSHKEVWGS